MVTNHPLCYFHNVYTVLFSTHPHPADRIEASFGIKKLAESIMKDGVIFNSDITIKFPDGRMSSSYKLLKEEKEKIALCDTLLKQCEYASNKLRSQGMDTRHMQTKDLKYYFDIFNSVMTGALQAIEQGSEWQDAKDLMARDMKLAACLTPNLYMIINGIGVLGLCHLALATLAERVQKNDGEISDDDVLAKQAAEEAEAE